MPAVCSRSRLARSEEHTSELQSHSDLVCRLLLEKKKKNALWRSFLLSFSLYLVVHLFPLTDPATTDIYTLSLHDALPISRPARGRGLAGSGSRAFRGR